MIMQTGGDGYSVGDRCWIAQSETYSRMYTDLQEYSGEAGISGASGPPRIRQQLKGVFDYWDDHI